MGQVINARRVKAEGYHVTATLETSICPSCSMLFAVPKRLIDDARNDRTMSIFCPAGHSIHWPGESREEKLERRLKWSDEARARNAAQLGQARASAAAHKGHATRIRNRIANGVCPCCNRTFKDLARHMKSQHPYFDPASHQGESE